ncbi:iron uptake transporter deferrochelatase/peroxidase subunit [Paenibacillus sp. UMB4589-SE434]|uniref:iron uptake transporter deferrochelatase/peroxidase subunit n=1 Tax=Paenibacillus sp. UMB4589-SE434 TaxID=3046314 RepID=UPI00254C9F38|nr:iron uptake transporter deferrochelatase/peroxidase subunit [Paenibacillus sp. UMB4589-SE434]MDK8180554.1 iron uptake transporter deferrochelatase/peroxidase subunit [Paenibacillus sp. UMB4589-SE434]
MKKRAHNRTNTTENKVDSESSGADSKLSRRELLKMAGVGGIGLLLGGTSVGSLLSATSSDSSTTNSLPSSTEDKVSFYGTHQSGITTPAQNFVCFGAFDLTTTSIEDVRKLLQTWTKAAAVMSAGQMIGDMNDNLNMPPSDTGEAVGLSTSRLTITFGAGPALFDSRFGLASKRPAAFPDLPKFVADDIQPQWSGGDLCVQVCADDLQVAFHALRNLTRIARGTAVLRWTQDGFQRSSHADPSGSTPRNLMGFKDGTGNPDANDKQKMNEVVWVQPGSGTSWMEGGSYMVVRRIRMRIEVWDRSNLQDQEVTFGRHRTTGAPLGGTDEFEPLDLEKRDAAGELVIPATAHSRLAHMDGKVQILRRAFSYSSGLDAKTGQIDAGLFFICYQQDLRTQFIPMQKKLAATDKLNEYIVHVGSATFACFPGAREGGYIGETLL